VVNSGVALGSAIGPVVGGLLGDVLGLRQVFLVGGLLLLASVVPVFLVVRESPRPPRVGPRVSTVAMIRAQPGLIQALAVLIGAQGLISVCNSASQPLVVLRLLQMMTSGVSFVTGVAFGLAGLASSVAAVGYTRLTRRYGYVATVAVCAALTAVAIALIGVSPWVSLVVIAVGLNGLFGGVIIPATAAMIGLETPHEAQSTVFGFNASSIALGFFIGPLMGGSVAALTGNVSIALFVVAVLAVLLSAIVAKTAREPAR
jgi:MFS transporter, DHA1 family, multidrug resistance protein